MKNFQLILVIIFIFGGVLGVMVFAGLINLDSTGVNKGPTGTVTLWGTVPSNIVNPTITKLNDDKSYTIRYVAKNPQTFDRELLEAIALGQGPDLFLMPHDLIYKYSNKIATIPYANYPLVNFKNNFAQAGDIFLLNTGILALPITVDPLVMYYNRSVLDDNNVAFPPEFWDQLPEYVSKFTIKNDLGGLSKGAFALGQYANITHAKELLSAMFLQVGNPIVTQKFNAFFGATLFDFENVTTTNNIIKTIDFYSTFTNPLRENYTWNKSFPNSIDAFSKEDLVFYFGMSSDLRNLLAKNPNHNFQVAPIPQHRNQLKTTFANVTGLSVSSFSRNPTAAWDALYSLALGDFAASVSASQYIPPARRDLLNQRNTDLYFPVFYSSALFAKSWLDPSAPDTNNIFRLMIEDILSNAQKPETAVISANNRINLLFRN